MRDAKYLFAYLLPLSGYLGLYLGGIWAPGSIYLAFVLLPLVEQLWPPRPDAIDPATEAARSRRPFFDWLLYLNLPLLYGAILYFCFLVAGGDYTTGELVGWIGNVGLMIGAMGINVGHELGHRTNRTEQLLAQVLLLPGLYQHFFIEHNRGHHKNVATPEDPASAERGQTLYAFWVQSVVGSWRNAWRLEAERLRRAGLPVGSWHNLMVRFQVVQVLYLAAIGIAFGPFVLAVVVAAGVFGFLMLESVNYIEHYGLRRKRLPSGRYEPVTPLHSWNSDHELGRIFLYELTRHSDHHFKATRKYQILRRYDESPQLPAGYPASILLSLVPPLWFRVMDGRLVS
jgi:alkane 1-monooxygenase